MMLSQFIEQLSQAGHAPRPGRNRWISRCPAHEDQRPSLSVAEGRDGRVLIKCHAGCAPTAVVSALGLTMSDLFHGSAARDKGTYNKALVYELKDEKGNVVALHHRRDQFGKKKMWWTTSDGKNGLGGVHAAALPLYGVERLLQLEDGSQVVVVEGEKAARALLGLGIPAVGTVTGAATVPADASLRPLLRLHPLLWPDADDPGRSHMDHIAARLKALGVVPDVVEWKDAPDGGDAADLVVQAGGEERVRALLAGARPHPAMGQGDGREPVLVCVADVKPEIVHWLWHPYIPLGKLTILEGDPGLGKSYVALAVITALTRGAPLPGVMCGQDLTPQRAIYLTAEDGIADTLRPRLDSMGAAVELVHVLEGRRDDKGEIVPITLEDIDVLERALQRTAAKVVVIDPIQGFLGANVDAHRANEVRPLLTAVGRLAAKFKCAVILIRHLRKSGADRAIHAGLGSIDFAAAARSILLVGQSPEAEDLRILAHSKSSLAKAGGSQSFKITDGRFQWTGPSSVTPEELSAPPSRSQKASVDEACEFLKDMLGAGPVAAADVRSQAAEVGIADRTLDRAKARLDIRSERVGGAGRAGSWQWSTPSATDSWTANPTPKEASAPKDASLPLGGLGDLSAGQGEERN